MGEEVNGWKLPPIECHIVIVTNSQYRHTCKRCLRRFAVGERAYAWESDILGVEYAIHVGCLSDEERTLVALAQ